MLLISLRKATRLLLAAAVLASAFAFAAQAQTTPAAADTAGIRQAALDYVEGWYECDTERMRRAVHPELAKRIVREARGRSRLGQQGAMTLVRHTGNCREERRAEPSEQRKGIDVLDMYRGAASARVDANGWVDYLHLAKWGGEWKIVNVLWELRPRARQEGGSAE